MKSRFVLATLLLAFAVGCTKKRTNTGTLTMRLPTEPPTLDWTLATDNVSKEVIQNLHEGLVYHDNEARVQPGMAESWTISPDGLVYTFKLRGDFKWSDGQPVVAQQFVDSWQRALNPKEGSEYAYFLFDIENAREFQAGKVKDFTQVGVKAIDDRTLVVKLKRPVAYWINVPGFWVTFPIRKDVIAKFGDRWTDPKNIVTAGPYILKEHEHESKIVLEKNPHYPFQGDTKGMPERAEFRIVKEDSTAVALFDSGAIDILRDPPPVQIVELAKRKEFVASPYLRGFYIGFNIKDPQVSELKVRQALGHAIDRNELKSIKALEAMITPMSAWILPGMIGHDASRGLKFDPELAKKIWAGLKKKPTQIEFWYDQKDFNKIVAENLQAQWKRVLGVDVQLSNQEWKVYLKSVRTKAPPLWRLGWGADYPDPDTFMALFTCKSGNNFTGMCSSEFDRLIELASRKGTDQERAKSYAQAEKILLEDQAAILPLFQQANLHLVTQRVSGFKVNPMGDFEFKELRLK